MPATTAVRERPILFGPPMVRAILDGRKTQTRRIVRLPSFGPTETPGYDWIFRDRRGAWNDYRTPDLIARKCPYGPPGGVLWCRETWGLRDTEPGDGYPGAERIFYRATDGNRPELRHQLWRPSIFMPRWASRITLEVVAVRVERLQGITEDDAVAEGFRPSTVRWWQGFERHPDGSRGMIEGGASPDGPPPGWMESPEIQSSTRTARDGFLGLWDEINGKRAGCDWNSNPFCWVLSFRRID